MKPRTRPQPRPRRARAIGPWKHGSIPVIGLIGEIGGGKSRAAESLAGRGAFVLDADAVGHALLDQAPVRERVVERFGPDILSPPADAEGRATVDRNALGAIVFAQPEALRDLESILHPRMRGTFERAIAREERRGRATAVVLDAAILLEAGWESLCDRVLFVEAPRDERLERVRRQRGWTEETLRRREEAQWPSDKKRRLADAVIVNDGSHEDLDAAVTRFWESLVAGERPGRQPGRPDGDARR